MIDLQLLRIMREAKEFHKCWRRIPMDALNVQTNAILTDFKKYFDRFPEHEWVDIATFTPMFFAWHPSMNDETKQAFTGILGKLNQTVPEETRDGVMAEVLQMRLGADLATLLMKYEAGDIEHLHQDLANVVTAFEQDANVKTIDYLRDDIGDLLAEEADKTGLRWRLDCLNQATRGLTRGEFGIIAGRPDKGKTTLVVSEVTYMAPQLPEGKTVVWLNNEGPGRKIISRLYQGALGLKMSEMIEHNKAGKLQAMYDEYMGEPWKIRVFDAHALDTYAVEQIIAQHNAGIVVFDMIDNIHGFKDSARTDLLLEEMYKWARNVCIKYDCIGIATSQISNEGDGLQFPTLGMLKDSKTGKQGACDFQMMLGASNDPNLGKVRYISLPKNKLRREGYAGDPRATVKFEPEIARLESILVDSDGEAPQDEQG